jgi:branched-chain amino acid transport system permease protein
MPPSLSPLEYLFYVSAVAGIYVAVAVATDLTSGITGIISLAQAAVFGTGAYVTALCAASGHANFMITLPASMLGGACASAVVGLLAVRLKEDQAVVGTIALQMVFVSVITNWQSVTRGPFGIPGIPALQIFGLKFETPLTMAIPSILLATATLWVVRRIQTAPLGRALQAVRDDEVFARAMGKDPRRLRLIASLVSGALVGLAGSLFASLAGFIDPASFTLSESVFILSMVILGGAGSVFGPAVGAATLIAFPELLRFIGMPAPVIGNVRQIIYGLLLIGLLMSRPSGIWGSFNFRRDSR